MFVFLLVMFSAASARAFSLLGPYADWMQITNGYQQSVDIGGPMNIGQGYRWNVPVVTYAFDQSFVDYFGSNGVAAIESAIDVLNNLPPASQINLADYPLDTTGENFLAASQSLVDLKSTTLFLLLQQLGLAQPSRFVYAVHDFSVTNGSLTAAVLQRNFDPVSLAPTNDVNGVDLQYSLQAGYDSLGQLNVDETSYPLDPMSDAFTAVADGGGFYNSGLNAGAFYTGLTRDDVGGLRYLLGANNYAMEPLLPDVHGIGTNIDSYVNVALRSGVDKITFVRQEYDALNKAYIPITNQFIDTYMTNGVVKHQQLARVVTAPDIVFSVVPYLYNSWGFSSTGTSNWLNSSATAEGPGIIRPPINITFQHQITASAITGDYYGLGQPYLQNIRWGSFDGSAKPPVDYPSTFQTNINTFEVYVQLMGNPTNLTFPAITNLDFQIPTNVVFAQDLSPQIFHWKLPVAFGQGMTLETSSNLVDWQSEGTITNYGLPLLWNDASTIPRKFFRAAPQTNSP